MLTRQTTDAHTSSSFQSQFSSSTHIRSFTQGACWEHKKVSSRRCRGGPVRVRAGAADVLGVLAFSALPFAAVQALADSDLGKKLQRDLEQRKDEYKRVEEQRSKEYAAAQNDSVWYGEARPKWLGPLDYDYPAYLRGEAPGDYAYDPLQLSSNVAKFDQYFEYELLHARWAMLGALGAVIPEILQYSGVSDFLEARWWAVGGAKAQGEDLNYLGISGFRIAGGQGIAIIAICQVLLMFGPEYARACGIEALEPLGIYLPGDNNYPGGVFDPLGLSEDPARFADLQVKEIKNGRLALVAWVGFAAQAAVTRKGPIADMLDFAADPVHNNIFAYLR